MRPTVALIALGSNQGDAAAHLRTCASALLRRCVAVQLSRLYVTPPVYVREQPAFLNAVAKVETTESLRDFFTFLRTLERDAGRQRGQRNGPRSLDVDLLTFGDQRCESPDLTLPHPRIAERAFVLIPLRDVEPTWCDPGTGRSIALLLEDTLDDSTQVRVHLDRAWEALQQS